MAVEMISWQTPRKNVSGPEDQTQDLLNTSLTRIRPCHRPRQRVLLGQLQSPVVWVYSQKSEKHCLLHFQQRQMSRDMTKPTKWLCTHWRFRSAWASICPVWSEYLLSAWRKLGSLAAYWVHSEGSDQTRRMPRLIWVFAGHTLILLAHPSRRFFWWAYRIGRPPSSVVHRPHSLNIFSSETTGPIKVIFHMELLWDGGTKVCSNGPGHMTKMAAMPIYGKFLEKSSSLEPKGRWPWNIVCVIGCSSTTKFAPMITLGWPWHILQQGQIVKFGPLCFCVGKR